MKPRIDPEIAELGIWLTSDKERSSGVELLEARIVHRFETGTFRHFVIAVLVQGKHRAMGRVTLARVSLDHVGRRKVVSVNIPETQLRGTIDGMREAERVLDEGRL